MKNALFSIFALLLTLAASSSKAQQGVDVKAIKAAIEDINSPYYYPILMARYKQLDTTLTAADYHYLYYGYAEQSAYMPLITTSYADSLAAIASQRTQPKPADLYKMVYFAEGVLELEPFNLRDINVLAFACSLVEQKERAAKLMRAFNMIYNTIISTGDGLTEQSAWWIIYSLHAEDVMNIKGASYGKPIIVSSTVEFFPVYNMPQKGRKGYFFNFSEIYARRPTYLDDIPKQKRKMELNPLYNPKSKDYIFKKK